MKKILIIFFFFLASAYCYSQIESNHVLVSSGNTIISKDMSVDWIVGENLIEHEVLFNLSSPKEPLLPKEFSGFNAYPTITSDWVNIQTELEDQTDLYLEVFNLSLQPLKIIKWEANPQKLNLESYPHGLYFITIKKKNAETQAVFKIIRL